MQGRRIPDLGPRTGSGSAKAGVAAGRCGYNADYPGPLDFDAVVEERLGIVLHQRLTQGAGGHMAAGN